MGVPQSPVQLDEQTRDTLLDLKRDTLIAFFNEHYPHARLPNPSRRNKAALFDFLLTILSTEEKGKLIKMAKATNPQSSFSQKREALRLAVRDHDERYRCADVAQPRQS